MKKLSKVVENFPETIFTTMTNMANEHGALNLSQGFPDFNGPQEILDLFSLVPEDVHQYAPAIGVNSLRAGVANYYKRYYKLNFHPEDEITIMNGATEAIYCTISALLNPGDEVVLFEPFYDSYLASVELAGGTAKPVTLNFPDFKFDPQELEAAFSDRTKLIILNSPHNPTGKVYNEDELQQILQMALKYDAYILSDEVYEFITFDKNRHIPIATLEKVKERIITISSVGKTFSFTGWKTGWVCAPKKLTQAIRKVHQYTTFCVPHPIQWLVSRALEIMEDYLPELKSMYQSKKDLFIDGLKDAGLNPLNPQGTYFALLPCTQDMNDVDFALNLIKEKKVASIPPSAFYMNSADGQKYVRFCFAKEDETLKKAIELLS